MSSVPHAHLLGSVRRSEADLPSPSVRVAWEVPRPAGEFFMSTCFLHIHDSNMYHYINMVNFRQAAEDADKSSDGSEISNNDVINVTEALDPNDEHLGY